MLKILLLFIFGISIPQMAVGKMQELNENNNQFIMACSYTSVDGGITILNYIIEGGTPSTDDNLLIYIDDVLFETFAPLQDGACGTPTIQNYSHPVDDIINFGLSNVPQNGVISFELLVDGETYITDSTTSITSDGLPYTVSSPTFFLPLQIEPTIIISEIFGGEVNSTGYDTGVWLELYNTTDGDIRLCDVDNTEFYHIQICPFNDEVSTYDCNYDNIEHPIVPIRCLTSDINDSPSYFIPSNDRFLVLVGINSNNYTTGWNNNDDYVDIFNYPDSLTPKVTFKSDRNHPDGLGGYFEDSSKLKFQLEHYFEFSHGRCDNSGFCVDGHWDGDTCTNHSDCGIYAGYSWDIDGEGDIVDTFRENNNSFTVVIYNGNPNIPTTDFPGEIIYRISYEFLYDTGNSKEFSRYDWSDVLYQSEDINNWIDIIENSDLEYTLPFPPIKCEDSYIYSNDDVLFNENFNRGSCSSSDKWYKYNYGTLSCVDGDGDVLGDCPDNSIVGDDCGSGGTCYGQWLVPNEMVFRKKTGTIGGIPSYQVPQNFGSPLQQNYYSCFGQCLDDNTCTDTFEGQEGGIPLVCELEDDPDCMGVTDTIVGYSCDYTDCRPGIEGQCNSVYSDNVYINDSCGSCIIPNCFGITDGTWMNYYVNNISNDCTGQNFYDTSVPLCRDNLLEYDPDGSGNGYENGTCDGGFCNGGHRNHPPEKVSVDGHPCTQDSDCGEYNWWLYGDLNDLTFNDSCHGCRDVNGGYVYDGGVGFDPVTLESRPSSDCRRIPGGDDNICCEYYVELTLHENPTPGKVDLYIKNKKPLTSLSSIRFENLPVTGFEVPVGISDKYEFTLDGTQPDGSYKIDISYLGNPLWTNNSPTKLLTIDYDISSITPNSVVHIKDGVDYVSQWLTGGSSIGYSTNSGIFVDCDGVIAGHSKIDACENCLSGYYCNNQNPITEIYFTDYCDDYCGLDNCKPMDYLHNDYPNGTTNNGTYFWNGSCQPIIGDIDGLIGVNIADIVIIVANILGNYEIPDSNIAIADIDEDYEITVSDILIMIDIILNGQSLQNIESNPDFKIKKKY